jgi:hypothetical protein
MNRSIVMGLVAALAVSGGTLWFMRDSADGSKAAPPAGTSDQARQATPPVIARPVMLPGSAASRPVATDPRLASLIAAPEGALVDFLLDADGRLIKEMDSDPSSPGYRRPLREYSYSGDRVIRLVKYQYTGNETRIIRTDVVYRLDGSIDQYHETTSREQGR